MNNDLWVFKEAKAPTRLQRLLIITLIITGIIGIINLADWWFTEFHIANKFMFILLSFFFWYEMLRNILGWLACLRISKPPIVPKPALDLSVAVFTTSTPGEPLSMFENTLKALQQMDYPHTTYLLDNTNDPEFRLLAERYGAVFLSICGVPGAKAGKINKALTLTNEEFILILDPDHIVFPNFLDQTLGFFQDPKVGFVQVSQGYYNQYRSSTATGAAEQTYGFYGPMQMGLYSYNAAVAIGANCTFRRTALESIGGHAQGLAEDLQTSIRIHSKGWKSVYNPVIVSRGLVPEDFGSFCKQQLKWARGVFEVLFDDLPKTIKGLSFWQRIFYCSTATYYFFGFTTSIFILILLLYFFTGVIPGNMVFTDFLLHLAPIIISNVSLYFLNQQFFCDTASEKGFHLKGMILKYACWPVITYALILALLKKKIPYIPTEKNAQTKFFTPFLIPLLVYVLILVIGAIALVAYRFNYMPESDLLLSSTKTWGMLGFCVLTFLQSILGISIAYEALKIKPEDPWSRVQITEDKTIKVI